MSGRNASMVHMTRSKVYELHHLVCRKVIYHYFIAATGAGGTEKMLEPQMVKATANLISVPGLVICYGFNGEN